MQNKRLVVCLTGGTIAGLICLTGGVLSGNIAKLSFFTTASPLYNILMNGFFIGISGLELNYLLHGALIGFIVSLISSLQFLENGIKGFPIFTITGIIYGFLIELFATKVFNNNTEKIKFKSDLNCITINL